MEDGRFNIINKDPRFRQMPKAERKVKIDRRFEGMFKDKRFKLKYSVDKRGRPLNATTDDNLRRFYEMSESESDDESDDDERRQKIKKKSKAKNKLGSKHDRKLNKESLEDKPRKLKSPTKQKDVDSYGVAKSKTLQQKSKTPKNRDINISKKLKGDQKILSNHQDKTSRTGKQVKEGKSGGKSKPPERSKRVSPTVTDSEEELSDESGQGSSDKSLKEPEENEDEESDSDSPSSDSSEEAEEDVRNGPIPGPDLMRGEGNVESSSSSDSSSDAESEEEEGEGQEIEHGWGELDKDAPRDDMVSSRLAVCNMDWDRVKAQDILVLFNSFKLAGGTIKSVTIYPSEYGLQRMKEEDVRGPIELLAHEATEKGSIDAEEGDQYHRERLRKYQMQRLKYYYAVVVCDSKSTASSVYEHCDGLEYQSSSTQMDLRFIPEEMTFDEHKPKDAATEMPDTALYKPVEFRTTALHQSKVELTWDETDHVREKKTMEAFGKKDLEDADVQAYLASSSGEEDDIPAPAFEIEEEFEDVEGMDDDEGQISKYRALLQGIDEKDHKEKEEKEMGVEITWEPGLKDTAEELVKKKIEADAGLTPWEKYLEKKKQKKIQKREQKKTTPKEAGAADSVENQQEQAAFSDDELPAGVDLDDPFFKETLRDEGGAQSTGKKKKQKRKKQTALTAEEIEEQQQKKAELELLMMDEDDNKQHFNLKDIINGEKKGGSKKRKRKRLEKDVPKPEDNFQIDVKDSRFEAIYTSHLYAIDPSDSHYKKTKAMEALVKEKQQRRAKKDKVDRTMSGEEEGRKKGRKMEERTSGAKKDQELSVLVKSIKSKTEQFNARKSKKEFGR